MRLYLERRTGRFSTPGEALGAMCDHVFDAWGARFEHKGSVFARDKRITLCAFHHLRGVHQRNIRTTGAPSLGLRFEFPRVRFAAGDRRLGSSILR